MVPSTPLWAFGRNGIDGRMYKLAGLLRWQKPVIKDVQTWLPSKSRCFFQSGSTSERRRFSRTTAGRTDLRWKLHKRHRPTAATHLRQDVCHYAGGTRLRIRQSVHGWLITEEEDPWTGGLILRGLSRRIPVRPQMFAKPYVETAISLSPLHRRSQLLTTCDIGSSRAQCALPKELKHLRYHLDRSRY